MTDAVDAGAAALLASGLDEFNPRHTSMATARDVARIVLSAMPESLLAAQREAIAEAIRVGIDVYELADVVLGLVGAWLVGAVQAERERACEVVQAFLSQWEDVDGHEADAVCDTLNDLLNRLAVVSRDTRSSSDE